jgi:hypothetical protein
MDAGSTFLLTQVDNHLWIVLSDPKIDASNVLLVSVTTATRLKESVCLLNVGDHPWIRHESCVSYEHAKVVKMETLDELKFQGLLKLEQPISATILKRVREGAARSVRMRLEDAQVLIDQGLIES